MSDNDEVLVTMAHVRQNKMCAKGSRAFCQRHGIDWQKFLKEGISSKELEKTGDAMIDRLIELARGR